MYTLDVAPFISKEQFRKVYSESVRSKVPLTEFFKNYAISVIPSAFRTPNQEKLYSLNMPLGMISFHLSSEWTNAGFSMNQAILDVAGDSGRKTLYRLCHEFKKTIADYSISGLSDAMYDTVSAVYAFPGVRELIMELESITNKAHNTIYRVVSYENGTETELLKTSRYSDGIDMMRRLEDALPDYPMAFRGYSGSHIIPIAGYDKETKVKELFMKRDFSISSCKCGNDEPIAAFVGNNFRCVKCSRHDVTRVKSFDHTASLLGTIKRLIEEMVDSKIITKWNSRCDIRFDRRDGRHAYVGIRVRRMLFRSIFRTDGSEIVMRIDSVNGWSSTERFKTARDFVLGLQKRISEECAHNDSNTEVPDTSSMSAASLEQFLRIELWTAGIEPAGIDVGKIDKGLIDVSIHNERGNSVDTVEFKIPFWPIAKPYEVIPVIWSKK